MICWSTAGVRIIACSVNVILVLGDIAPGGPHSSGIWAEQQVGLWTRIICHSSILHSIDSLTIVVLAANSGSLIRPLSLSLLKVISRHLVRELGYLQKP